jgi:hypothetical protein
MKFSATSANAGNSAGEVPRLVQDGIGSRSIGEELEGQSLLGVEGFAEGLRPARREAADP